MNPLLRRLHRHRFLVCLSLREISLFSKPHSRNPRRNLLCRKMVRIRIRTRLSTIGDSLLALVAGDGDVLIRLPESFEVPSFVPLDGDGFASWLTKQDKIKAGTITQEMQRRYAKEIRAATLEEFKSYLDNDTIRLTDRRRLNRDVNFFTGRWVLTVKVDKNGYFSKFKARWVCRGFQDKFAWDQQTDSPTATRYGFRLVAQCAANHFWDLFHLESSLEEYNVRFYGAIPGAYYNILQYTRRSYDTLSDFPA